MSKFILCSCTYCSYMFKDNGTYRCKKQDNKEIKLSEMTEDFKIKINGCQEFEFDESKVVPYTYDSESDKE